MKDSFRALILGQYPRTTKKELYRRLYLFYYVLVNQIEDKVTAHQFLVEIKNHAVKAGLPFINVLYQLYLNESSRFIQEHHQEWRNSLAFLIYGDKELEELYTDENDRKEAKQCAVKFIAKELEFELNKISQ